MILENNYAKERAEILFPLLEELCPLGIKARKKGKGNIVGFEELAVNEANLLIITYPDTKQDELKTYNTAYKQINSIKDELLRLKNTELKDLAFNYSIKTLIKNFTSHLYSLFAVYRKRYNDKYKEDLKNRSAIKNRLEINIEPKLIKAKEILEGLKDNEQIRYQEVVCAIALTTGRRMSEILLSGSFKYKTDYELIFSGQLKGKTRREEGKLLKNVNFTIPTLINSNLILEGINWLNKHNKRLDKVKNTPGDVNNKYSKYLSRCCKDNWNLLPEEHTKSFRFHFFRSIYFIACSNNYSMNGANLIDPFFYATQILGDNDVKTIQAYSRFIIKPGTKTIL